MTDDWKTNSLTHHHLIYRYLEKKYGFRDPSGLIKDVDESASSVAYYVPNMLERKAKHETPGNVLDIPKGWTLQDSYRVADIAYNIGKIANDKVISIVTPSDSLEVKNALDPLRIVHSYAHLITRVILTESATAAVGDKPIPILDTLVKFYLRSELEIPERNDDWIKTLKQKWEDMRKAHPKVNLPPVYEPPPFKDMVFRTKDGGAITGEQLIEEASRQRHSPSASPGRGGSALN